VPLPELGIGLVVRYEYLWHRRAATAETGDKDHPACVVATYRQQGRPEDFVVYLPISHTQPSGDEEGIELPDDVKRKAGLDGARKWILLSECNVDTWPFDLRQIPGRPGLFHYGHLPPSMFKIVRDAFVERYKAKRVNQVSRGGE
jgi:hypothetical protein